ncbi:MFS transporter [Serratia marcescens]|uniref:MFS transporter n=1 Tax=Serratia marcescens TaxID=615 RepID=UPI0002AF4219|nr:MFS transporter [Serratia marcescens]AGE17329.1 major facilitator superfamily transporter [Serratia marcescens WW4]
MSNETILLNVTTRQISKRNENLILAASLVSTLGSGILTIANALIISQSMGTAKAVGTLFILIALPQAFFSVLFGKLSDTYDRKKICIITNVVNAAIVIGVLAGINTFTDPSMVIFVCSFMLSMTMAMFFPANNAIIKDSVESGRMAAFNAKLEMAVQIGALTSVAIGGFLIQLIGVDFVFVLNAITFIASAALFFMLTPRVQGSDEVPEGYTASEPVPATTLPAVRKPWLMLLYGVGNIIVTVSNMLLVLLVTKHFASGAGVLGVVDALAGVGVAIAAAMTPFLQKRFSLLTIVMFGYVANAAFIALQPQFTLPWLMVFFPLGAVCFGLARISCRTLMFNTIPSHYTGRFFGFSNAIGLTSAVVLTYAIGELVDSTTVLAGYVALALAVVFLALLASTLVFKGKTK